MIYDISPRIDPHTPVYPGDQAFVRHPSKDMTAGDNYSLSAITSTLHIGAHADAPSHYAVDGVGIDQRDLHFYLGRCQVISVPAVPAPFRLQPAHVAHCPLQAPRILLRTESFAGDHWHDHFTALSAELVRYLAAQHVRLIGIDTPSVDPATEPELSSHHMLHHYDMAVLENLLLHDVPDGIYTLIALPLKISNADASPVRAILLTADHRCDDVPVINNF